MKTHSVPLIAPDGRSLVIAIAKQTWRRGRDGALVPHDTERGVRLTDEHDDDDAPFPSVKRPADVGPEKRGCDVVVVGAALSPKPVQVLDVVLSLGARTVPLRVHGERVYYRGATGVVVGPAAAFERKALEYQRCYGGASRDGQRIDWRNPAGRGVCKDASELMDSPAPQIEHAAHPIHSASDSPEPVCFGAVAMSWEPRRSYFGSCDEGWQRERMPLAPHDYDVRAANVAHPLLQLDQPAKPGDVFALQGMSLADGPWHVSVPDAHPRVVIRRDDGQEEVIRPALDTVLLEPNDDLVELTYRAVLLHGRGRRRLREVKIDDG